MNNLSIQQFCKVEAFKAEVNSLVPADLKCRQKTEGNLTIMELLDDQGSVVQELILVV